MNARHEVLAAESLGALTLSRDDCYVLGGLWRDAYTGETTREPSKPDVGHVVPLAEAHRSGGHAWDQERRAAFANDLGDTRALIAVSASANRPKGDQGPEEWLPSDAADRCRYVASWVAVKARWSLSMNERERVTVGSLPKACAKAESASRSPRCRSVGQRYGSVCAFCDFVRPERAPDLGAGDGAKAT
jgi:hypothetical protein